MLVSEMLSLLLESLESSDLWGIWNGIVMILEVGAKSLFITHSFAFQRRERAGDERPLNGWSRGRALSSRPRFLAALWTAAAGAIQAVSYFACLQNEGQAVLYCPPKV